MPITVKRLSDNKSFTVPDADERTKVGHLKKELKANLAPKFEHGMAIFCLLTIWYLRTVFIFFHLKRLSSDISR